MTGVNLDLCRNQDPFSPLDRIEDGGTALGVDVLEVIIPE